MDKNDKLIDRRKAAYWAKREADKRIRESRPKRLPLWFVEFLKEMREGGPAPKQRQRSTSREEFIKAYRANPLNFLSGQIVHDLQKIHAKKKGRAYWDAMMADGQRILDERHRRMA